MKLLPENKPFVDYAETGLHDAIQQRLFRFSQEELDCREYYRMEADPGRLRGTGTAAPHTESAPRDGPKLLGSKPRSPML